MTYLVVEGSATIRTSLCYVLLSFGIKGLPASSRREALDILGSQAGVEGAIVDIDTREVEGPELIRQMRESEALQKVKVIVHTVQSSKELVAQMVEAGVAGYLLKPYKENQIYAKLKKVLDRTLSHDSQRKHIRVKPDPDELLRLHFRLPGLSGMISGRVVDISVGGVAVELFNPPPQEALKPLTQIPSIQFTLLRKQFAPPGKVVLFRENLLALRFDFLTTAEKTALARYVFNRIAS
jgi:DNA-binding response OmpR family regulator